MKIEKAAEMGFCFGVRRAIELAERVVRERGSLQSLGPIVHNQQVVASLAAHGVAQVESLDDVQSGIMAIPSRGVTPQVIEQARARGFQIVDTTCPFVRKAQRVAQQLGKAGVWALIFGDAAHPEVQGILGWAGDKAMVTLEVPKSLPQRLGVLSQTTQSQSHFAHFLKELIIQGLSEVSELRIFNTICDATRKRQEATLDLATRSELMVVIGGRNSSNTRRLAEICASAGVETHHIETAAELDPSWLKGRHRVGVTAGASTPDQVIDGVLLKLEQVV